MTEFTWKAVSRKTSERCTVTEIVSSVANASKSAELACWALIGTSVPRLSIGFEALRSIGKLPLFPATFLD